MKKGRIFSIEEFSTFDGPGIRMSVFLKGCPLRCSWCHNPEGQRIGKEIARSPNGCLECGACLRKGEELTGSPCLVYESISVCPRRLIRECGQDVSPEELVAKIDKNIAILNMNGGGVTFSGGEPLMQADFVIECLELLEGRTNRAIQTCGYCDNEKFVQVLDNCDYVLYDLKLIDDAKHIQYTGVSNDKILQNYRTLAQSGKEFCTRIPLIPTVNDTEQNAIDTAKFMSECGVRYIEMLPYNKMAGGKYMMMGREYEPGFDETVEPNTRMEIYNSYGIEVKVL